MVFVFYPALLVLAFINCISLIYESFASIPLYESVCLLLQHLLHQIGYVLEMAVEGVPIYTAIIHYFLNSNLA